MKKIVILMLMLALGGVGLKADEQTELRPLDDWSFFQLGLFFNVPSSMEYSNIYGIKTGWPISDGKGRVYGLEASWLYAGTHHLYGFQGSWVSCYTEELKGIQSAFVFCRTNGPAMGLQATFGVSMIDGPTKGIQGSLAYCQTMDEYMGLQAAFLTMTKDLYGFQASGVGIADEVNGVQVSLAGFSKGATGALLNGVISKNDGPLTGVQTAIINMSKEVTGVQFGLINIAEKTGFQFGLINYIKGGVIPFFPFCNISIQD